MITFIADATANTGYIHGLESQLSPLLNDMKEVFMENWKLKLRISTLRLFVLHEFIEKHVRAIPYLFCTEYLADFCTVFM